MAAVVRVIAKASRIEGEASRQLQATAQLEGVRLAVGLPDLHPGRGHPIGAAFVAAGVVYPHLVGNDIGCGMALLSTDLVARKAKRDRWVSKLSGLESPWDGDVRSFLDEAGLAPTPFDHSLGTIGGGNHFAELQSVEEVHHAERFHAANLDDSRMVLLVHSGSRGLGESTLRAHTDQRGAAGLKVPSDEASAYLQAHDRAVAWARVNRALIARRFLDAISSEGAPVLDVCHNSVTARDVDGETCFLHRKGAAPSDEGLLVIPGSRGAFSHLVAPIGDGASAAWSLAHGAGRKWTRADARSRGRARFRADQLVRTSLGGAVICEDKELLFEEAPDAYKHIDDVISDLLDEGLIERVATLRPLITYKVRVEE